MYRIYLVGPDDDFETPCEALDGTGLFPERTEAGSCDRPATYRIEDRDSIAVVSWMVCADHKEGLKARGEAI